MLAFPILFLLSLWVFRGFVAALLPLFVGALTVMGTFLGLRLVNEATLLSIFALNLAIALGLGLAIDYSLFIVSRYREELARGLAPGDALRRTIATAGRTVLFSALTVSAALLALLVFPQRFLYSMGISGALTALIAAAVSLTALPALLAVLGPRVNALAPARWQHTEDDPRHGLWYRLSHGVMRRPVVVAATASAVSLPAVPALLGAPAPRVPPLPPARSQLRVVDPRHGLWYRLSHGVMRRPVVVAVAASAVLLTMGLPFTGVQFTGVDASVL